MATQNVTRLVSFGGASSASLISFAYAYDAANQRTGVNIGGARSASPVSVFDYTYDPLNRVNIGGASSTSPYYYRGAGWLWQETYGNGDVMTHGYDAESRLLSLGITNGTTLVTCYSYGWDAGGNILAITNQLGGASYTSLYSYDAAGQLTNEVCLTNSLPGGQTNSWIYDEAGNWLNAPQAGTKWVYNADNELLARANTTDTNWSITVTGQVEPDPASNKWYNSWAECRGVRARVGTNTGLFSLPGVPLRGGSNELVVTVTDVSGNSYTTNRWIKKEAAEYFFYDGNGNLTNWVNGTQDWRYEWDWADRLTKVTSNGVVVLENWYDAQSCRIAKQGVVNEQTNKVLYLYDGWDIVAVMNGDGQIVETFTRGVGLAGDIGTLIAVTHHARSWANGTFYIHNNHRGDIILTRSGTTINTATVGRYDYSSFGILNSTFGSNVCRFTFSSKERDPSTGLGYYGYRYYAPQWQRWVNRDPLSDSLPMEMFEGSNLYTFVRNIPPSWVDRDGLVPDAPYLPPPRGYDPRRWPLQSCLAAMCRVWERAVPGARGWWGNPPDSDDRFEHCRSSRELARACGRSMAASLAYVKEGIDWLKGGFSNPGYRGDMQANAHGRNGVDCPKQSCEDYCRSTRGQYPPAGE